MRAPRLCGWYSRWLALGLTIILFGPAPAQIEQRPAQGKAEAPAKGMAAVRETLGWTFPLQRLDDLGIPTGPRLLLNKSVQEDLKVGPEQASRLRKAKEQIFARHKAEWDRRKKLEKEHEEKQGDIGFAIRREIEKGLSRVVSDVLQPEQIQRFRQIELQTRFLNAFFDPQIREALGLSPEQRKSLEALARRLREDRTPSSILTPVSLEEREQREAARAREAMKNAVAQLTTEQRKRWQEMIGPPFQWDDAADARKENRYVPSIYYDLDGLRSVDKSTVPQRLLKGKVQQELKLTGEQVARLRKIEGDVRAKYKEELERLELAQRQNWEKAQTLKETVDKELTAALTKELAPEQAKRFEQIQLQIEIRQRRYAALEDDRVRNRLKLTDEQRKAIRAIREEEVNRRSGIMSATPGKSDQEILKETPEDRQKRMEVRRSQLDAVSKEMWDKALRQLTQEQRRAWEELLEPPFRLKVDFPRLPRDN